MDNLIDKIEKSQLRNNLPELRVGSNVRVNYKITEDSKVLVNRSLTQRSTYNNISDKFELSKSEEILKDNLIENLVSDIINSASNLILNPMINDN